MRLTRSWEEEYSPDRTGGLRISKASDYGAVGEEAGPGDRREGEVQTRFDGVNPAVERESADGVLPGVRRMFEEHRGSARETEELRRMFAERDDDPDFVLYRIGPGEWSTSRSLVVGDKGFGAWLAENRNTVLNSLHRLNPSSRCLAPGIPTGLRPTRKRITPTARHRAGAAMRRGRGRPSADKLMASAPNPAILSHQRTTGKQTAKPTRPWWHLAKRYSGHEPGAEVQQLDISVGRSARRCSASCREAASLNWSQSEYETRPGHGR